MEASSSKNIRKHQKTSKNIKKHQKTPKNTKRHQKTPNAKDINRCKKKNVNG